ncbi:MAG: VanZ family protein [Candidatus Delongbacteria bacterium]
MQTPLPLWTRPGPQLAAYALLLIVTPFLLLRAYLQQAIGELSRTPLPGGDGEFLLMPWLALLAAGASAWLLRRQLRPRSLAVLAGVLALWAAGHQVADYYFGHLPTDLQQNWHTLAYLIFAGLFWRWHVRRGRPAHLAALPGLGAALLLSACDETIQVFISSRIFDVGDIGKDAWGAAIGLGAVTVHQAWPALAREGWRPWRPRWRDYRQAAVPQLALNLGAAWLLLGVGSLLTDLRYLPWALLGWLGLTGGAVLLVHGLGRPGWRVLLGGLLSLGALGLGASHLLQPRDRIQACGRHWIVYSGLPLPAFDVLIRPDGGFRLVDKKHAFGTRDQQTLLRLPADILLIGSGFTGQGGLGFPEGLPVQFLPGLELERAVQLIVLPTPQACAVFNRLKDEGRRVTFVVHVSC